MSLKYLELKNTSENCSKLIFILHGYGADSNDLFSIATYWQRFLPDAFFAFQTLQIHVKLTRLDLSGLI